MSLTGTKHMDLGCANCPGDFRGWTVLLCVGLSMSTVNCDGHCQTANAKGESSWQVLPCDYKSAMVKVEKKNHPYCRDNRPHISFFQNRNIKYWLVTLHCEGN